MKADALLRLRQRLNKLLDRLSPRDRAALHLLFWSLVLAIAAQAIWSLEQARRTQLQQLPRVAGEALRSAVLGEAWQQLTAAPPPPGTSAVIERAIAPRLGELGPEVEAKWNGDRLHLSGKVELAPWLRWSAAMQKEYRMRLDSCRLSGDGRLVRLNAVYQNASSRQ